MKVNILHYFVVTTDLVTEIALVSKSALSGAGLLKTTGLDRYVKSEEM